MTIKQFTTSSYYVQRTMVQEHGSFLFKKDSGTACRLLYQVDDFYVEIPCTKISSNIGIIKCYSVLEIDEYLSLVDISAITDLLE